MFGRKNPVFFCKQKSDMSNGPFIRHVPEIKLQYIFYALYHRSTKKKDAFIFHKKCLKKIKQNIDKTRQKDEFRCLKFDTLD